MRIARALSMAGHSSRREAERLIAKGRVAVDGRVVTSPATLVDPTTQTVSVDGKALERPASTVYLAVHKPRGVTSTLSDPHAERTIKELAKGMGRLYPVGRLDKESEGLLLLTNDGDFANAVTHPRYGVSREYLALVAEPLTLDELRRLLRGIVLDGKRATPTLVENAPRGVVPPGDRERQRGVWVRIILREGRNREVRRLLAEVGHPVARLVRTRIGPVRLAGLKPGQYRQLKRQEVYALTRASRGSERDLDQTDAPPSDEQESGRMVVAIDGPAAAGKTTVGTLLAERLGAAFLDTGVLYRALALLALENGIALDDAPSLGKLAESLDVRVAGPEDATRAGAVLLGDRDISDAIHTPEVDANVSQVAAHAAVRTALVPAQRRAASSARAVVVGRDIGTVIFPEADLKIFLEASEGERARRRAAQLSIEDEASAVQEDLARRDSVDRARAVSPLVPAADAVIVDTDGLDVEDVVEQISKLLTDREPAG